MPDLFETGITHEDIARLRAGLAARAGDAETLDVAYRQIDSPLGPLLIAATPVGLVRVAFEREGFEEVLAALADKVSPRILFAPARLDRAATELAEYFAGERHGFDLPVDLSLSAGFRQQVQRYLPRIGYGHTRTYREVAGEVGNPGAVRAVGSACARNPLPIVLPCHRVVRTDGGLGGYLGGVETKRALLDLERGARAA